MNTRLAFSPSRFAFSLPGAWPSTDSLEEARAVPNANPLHEEPLFVVSAIPRSQGVKRKSATNATGRRSLRNSAATFDDDSDDFYSFVEPQEDDDVDAASLADAGGFWGVRSNQSVSSDSLFQDPNIENGGSENLSTSANPNLDHTEDAASSDDTSSSSQKMFGAPETPLSSPPSDVSNLSPPSECSRRTFLAPSTKDTGPTPRISLVTSLSRQSINSESSSSAHLGDEEFSHHLDQSGDESPISPSQVYNVIDDEVQYSNHSEESFPIPITHTSPPRGRRSLQIQRRVVGHQDTQLDILHLAQPDGHNPWTLSLEPTLLILSDFATASRTSVSVESSSVTHDVAPAASSESRPHTPITQNFSVAQNELRSEVGLVRPSVDLRPLHYAPPPSYSGVTIPQPSHKKHVVQKTKNLYQKMKRFFTPKSPKRNEGRGISSEMLATLPRDAPLAVHSPYANESSSHWSLNRRAFQKYAKASSPSVAHSGASGSTYYLPPGVTQDTRQTFEYRRPGSTDEVQTANKRNRRFSVPTPFYASSLVPGASSSSRNMGVPSSRTFGKRWSRIPESEH